MGVKRFKMKCPPIYCCNLRGPTFVVHRAKNHLLRSGTKLLKLKSRIDNRDTDGLKSCYYLGLKGHHKDWEGSTFTKQLF